MTILNGGPRFFAALSAFACFFLLAAATSFGQVHSATESALEENTATPGKVETSGADPTPPRLEQVFPAPGTWIVSNEGLSRVRLVLSEPVQAPSTSIRAWGVQSGVIQGLTFTSGADPRELLVEFSTPVRNDQLTLIVDSIVTDIAGNPLDGEIATPSQAQLPSGDGVAGGQAVLRFSILQGDADRSGTVDQADATIILASMGLQPGAVGFDARADLNGDGVVNVLDVAAYLLNAGATLPQTDGGAPAVLEFLPDPAVGLYTDQSTIEMRFSEAISSARFFNQRVLYVVDGSGDVLVPSSALLAPDGLSAEFTFEPPLSQCDRYFIRVSNALSDASGSLLVPPSPSPRLSGLEPAVAPTLDPYETLIGSTNLTLTGTAPNAAQVQVSGPAGQAVAVVGTDGRFTINPPLQNNRMNQVFVTSLTRCGVRSAPVTAMVTVDTQPPNLFIDFPLGDAQIQAGSTDVAGRVGDTHSGFMGLTVTVNGVAAEVDIGIGTNGTFFLPAVPLNTYTVPTVITVAARDRLGNTATRQITVTQAEVPPEALRMSLMSGNGQRGRISTLLTEPVVIKMTRPDGSPFPGKVVNFDVTRSDGRLAPAADTPAGQRVSMLQVTTDDQGLATMWWTLGGTAGCGGDRVSVTSRDIAGTIELCASATPAPPDQINIGSGNNQRGETNGVLPEPLRAWVSDGCNPAANIPITFTVTRGGGKVNGLDAVTVNSAPTGHAVVNFTLGDEPGINEVTATFDGNPTNPATFTAVGLRRDPETPTSFSGLVLDNASQPIGGARCWLLVNNVLVGETYSNEQGQFRFDALPDAGDTDLYVDGLPANLLNNQPIPQGSFPTLHFEISTVPNTENSLGMPVLLPMLNPNNARAYSRTQETVLTVEGVEGLKMVIAPGSMRLPTGQMAPEGTIVALNQVHHDNIPMPMPDGAAPLFAWTLQPAGAHFDPPIRIEYPNMSALPPGSIAYFLSFDHDTSRFEIVSSGHVTDDGSCIVTDEGSGLTISGWGCNCPPYSVTGECCNCDQGVNGCTAVRDCVILKDAPFPHTTISERVCFTSACNIHDRCYPRCGATQSQCDDAFYQDLLNICSNITFDELRPQCEDRAALFYWGVRRFGGSFYRSSQQEMCECRRRCGDPCSSCPARHEGATDFYINGLPLPYQDDDEDGLPDDWETAVGLDPTDPHDAIFDSDTDGLTNDLEFIHNTDPFVVDTDGNGINDAQEAEVIQPPPIIAVGPDWIFSAGGQSATPSEHGSFRITNLSASDLFGSSGPGSAPDFVSDDFLRVVGSAVIDGVTHYAFSDKFQIRQGISFTVGDLFISTSPTLTPESIRTSAGSVVLEPSDTTQLAITAVLGNGDERDITPRSECTVYRTSNPGILTVGPDGMATAHGIGTAFITASNEGVIGIRRIDVVRDAIETSVQGFVKWPDGSPVQGAKVSTTSVFGGEATTDASGKFTFTLGVPSGINLTAFARLKVNDRIYVAVSSPAPSIEDGITDSGILTLREVLSGPPYGPAETSRSVGQAPVAVEAADLEPDNDQDLIFANRSSDNLSLLRNMGGGNFAAAVSLPAGDGPFSVVAADFDNDGDRDIAAANVNSDNVTILRNDGASFALVQTRVVGDAPRSIVAAHLNGDNRIDLAVANDGGDSVSILLSGGPIFFNPAMSLPVGNGPESIAATNVDGDADTDLIVCNTSDDTVSVLLNQGDGLAYNAVLYTSVGDGPRAASAGDLDGDGDPDLAVVSTFDQRLTILRNTGGGMFTLATNRQTPEEPKHVAIADVDGDSRADVNVVSTAVDVLATFMNTGDAMFSAPTLFSAADAPESAEFADFSGDGLVDAAIAARLSNAAKVLRNRGRGQFGADRALRVGSEPSSATVDDIDSDGDRDIVVTNTSDGTVSLLVNDGQGGFASRSTLNVGGVPVASVVADFNSDNRRDLAIARSDGVVAVMLQRELGGFRDPMNYQAGSSVKAIAAGEVNGDSFVDLMVTNGLTGEVSVLAGGMAAVFGEPVVVAQTFTPEGLFVGRLDGDDRDDFALANSSSDRVEVFLNGPNGFTTPVFVVVGDDPVGLAAADFDGDNDIDLLTANRSSGTVSMLLNTAGGFPNVFTYAAGQEPVSVSTGDLDFDGDSDIIVANSGANTYSVLTNNNGMFNTAPIVYGGGERPLSIVITDIDNDADADAVGLNAGSGTVSTLRSQVLASGQSGVGATAPMPIYYPTPYTVVGMVHATGRDGGSKVDHSDVLQPVESLDLESGIGLHSSLRIETVTPLPLGITFTELGDQLSRLRKGEASPAQWVEYLVSFERGQLTETLRATSTGPSDRHQAALSNDSKHNADGAWLGELVTADGSKRATLFAPGLSPQDLGTLGGQMSVGAAIDDRWVVVGSSTDANGSARAYIKPRSGAIREAVDLPHASSGLFDLNEQGVAVGVLVDEKGESSAMLWSLQTGLIRLNNTVEPELGLNIVAALRVSDDNSILAVAESEAGIGLVLLKPEFMPEAQDIDADGIVDASDIGALLGLISERSPRADINLDGAVNDRDMLEFLSSLGARR